MASIIRQRRDGEFTARIEPDSIYCGLYTTPEITYRFQVELEADDSGLDENGFLVDNRDLERIFTECALVDKSCELLCHHFVEHVLRLCGDRKPYVRRCTVSLWAHPTAIVTREYVR